MATVQTRSFVKPCPASPERIDLSPITMNAVHVGSGRPIVFIHGMGWDHSLWGGIMSRLADRYLTIAGDTCGHGATDKPEGPYTVAGFAREWAALIAQLAGEKALIVGFSLGGMIAQVLALDHPELVGALVLANTSCRSPSVGRAHMEERASALKEKGPHAAATLAAQSVFSPAWREANPAQLADFVDWRIGHDHRALGEAMRAASNFDVCDRLDEITVPTLVVTALGDELMLPSDQALLCQLISHAEYAEIAASGHMMPIEQAEVFESAIEGFLERHWPAGTTIGDQDDIGTGTAGLTEDSAG